MYRHEQDFNLYEKRGSGKGSRYITVSQYDNKVHDAFPAGFALVHTQPGSTSIRYGIEPDIASLMAAAKLMEDAMVNAVREESEFRPNRQQISKKEREAYEVYKKAAGDNIYLLSCKSSYDIVQAGLKVLIEYAQGVK